MADDEKNGITGGEQDQDADDQDLDNEDDDQEDIEDVDADDIDDEDEEDDDAGDEETVPVAAHLKLKNKYRKARQELKKLTDAGQTQTPKDLEELAKKHKVKPEFLKDLAEIMGAQARQEVQKDLGELKAERVEEAFSKTFDEEIAAKYPQLADKKKLFKLLAFQPENKKKTLEAIAVENFGNLLGSEGVESAGGGADIDEADLEKIDFSKMSAKQHQAVLANPKAKAAYYRWKDEQGL